MRTTWGSGSPSCAGSSATTGVGDPTAALGDDLIAYLAPLFYRETQVDEAGNISRHFNRDVRTVDLDEDYGPIPNPDELRARVTLTRVPDPEVDVVRRESNLVKKETTL